MQNIIVIGNTLAGWAAVEELKRQDAGRITVISQDGFTPRARNSLTDAFGQLSSWSRDLTESKRMKDIVCLDKKVLRLSLNRKKVTLEGKQQLDFDQLILADTGSDQISQVKGHNKTGVLALNRGSQALTAAQGLVLAETVAVCTQTLHGLRAVLRLLENKKEVLWILPGERILPGILDKTFAAVLEQILTDNRCRLLKNTVIQEILGDSDCKAVRLDTGKVFGCEMVLFPDAEPDLRLVSDSALHLKAGRISTDEGMLCSLPGIYAAGRLSSCPAVSRHQDYDTYAEVLQQQGRLIAATILQQSGEAVWPFPQCRVSFGGMSLDLLGDVSVADDRETMVVADGLAAGQKPSCRCLTVRGKEVLGATFLNDFAMAQNYKSFVEQRVTVDQLPDAWVLPDVPAPAPLSPEALSADPDALVEPELSSPDGLSSGEGLA